jgi:hypothetical protein
MEYSITGRANSAATSRRMWMLSASRIREHTRFLASDLLEGRGVGARGGEIAAEYIATQLALAGAKPAGDNGTYYQKVPLVGIETQPGATLGAAVWGKGLDLRWGDDFVGVSQTQRPDTRFEGEAVFVGHGITAPEFHWDDYKGVDVTGKVLIMFTNEPPSTDPKFFDGRALTYYGRWVYKYEEALRRGARRASSSTPRRRPATGGTWCATPGAGKRRS